ncbi:hypothetical protein ACHHYP_11784 [Achlya hypogyna]|uniref:VPS9 domain-containing protein n=1 Tax=Achlya hypogyna TaxID=1202772 RepID=A0A1V9YIH8_ACHHY|nr:hypothetical protein ACHHYP_11784 [Achlya hypogyna]
MVQPFLREFEAHLPALLDRVPFDKDGTKIVKCLMCVPQSLSLLTSAISVRDLETHFLVPDASMGQYRSLDGKCVAIAGVNIHTKTGFRATRVVRILMTEDYPLPSATTIALSLVHINRPLEGGVAVPDDIGEMDMRTFRRYIAMIRAYPESEAVFQSLDHFVRQVRVFPPSHPVLGPESLQRVWRQSTNLLVENGTLDLAPHTHQRSLQLDQAVESYLLEQLHDAIMDHLRVSCAHDQHRLEATWRDLRYAVPSDFNIRMEFQVDPVEALMHLSSAMEQRTPLDMLLHLKRAMQAVQEAIHARLLRHNWPLGAFHLSTDDVLDQLLFLLAQAAIERPTFPLAAMVSYMDSYHFVPATVSAIGFTIANFQVALEWCLQRNEASPVSPRPRVDLPPFEPSLPTIDHFDSSLSTTEDVFVTGADAFNVAEPIYAVACGHRYFAVVAESGMLSTWGDAYGGRLGYPHTSNRVLAPQRVVGVAKVLQVACGAFHMLACDVNGHVHAWGTNSNGQLGWPSTATVVVTPEVVIALRGTYISAVACGDAHSLALSSTGNVYSWGSNRFLQLGRHTILDDDAARPERIDANWAGTTAAGTRRLDPSVGDASPTEPGAALRIAAGAHHSLAIARDGTLFTWGCGVDGRLGLGSHADTSRPTPVLSLSETTPVDTGGGATYSCVLLKSGHVVVAGVVAPDLPPPTLHFAPLVLPGPVRRAVFGERHCVFVLADDRVVVYGSNVHGQCDLGGAALATVVATPTVVPVARPILHLAAGASHTLVVQAGFSRR